MKCLRLLSVLLIFSGCLSGCVSPPRKMVVECEFPERSVPPGPALVAQEYGEISVIPLNAVQYTDHSLLKRVAVMSLKSRRTATNTVEVYSRFINCTGDPIELGVRTGFLDESQIATEPTSAWASVWVQPYAMADYRGLSVSSKVANYYVEVRRQ